MKTKLVSLLAFCLVLLVSQTALAQYTGGSHDGYAMAENYDIPLPVVFATFTAQSLEGAVILSWRTESEVNNLGFSIYRSEVENGRYTKVNASLIQGMGTDEASYDYSFIDDGVVFGKTYYYYIEDVDISGKTNKSHTIKVTVDKQSIKTHPIPLKFALLQNYPNPFNPETWFPYELATDATVAIHIYNINGHLVRQLDLGKLKAGSYVDKKKAAYWDGKDENGNLVASGVYFYTLHAGDFQATRRMLIVK
jgi:hypothetical protein